MNQSGRLLWRRVAVNAANSSRTYEPRDVDLPAAAAVIGFAGLPLIGAALLSADEQTPHVANTAKRQQGVAVTSTVSDFGE